MLGFWSLSCHAVQLKPVQHLPFFFDCYLNPLNLHSFPTRRSSDLIIEVRQVPRPQAPEERGVVLVIAAGTADLPIAEEAAVTARSEEHTSELQSRGHLVCRLLLEKKKTKREGRANPPICRFGASVY